MNSLVVSGMAKNTLNRKVKSGEVIKVARSLYLSREPKPVELAEVLMGRFPKAVFTGLTACQIMTGRPLTFPLHLAADYFLPKSTYFFGSRTTLLDHWNYGNLRAQVGILAAQHLEHADAIAFLESVYASKNGRSQLEQDLARMTRIPKSVRELIEFAATGSDSGPERDLVKQLRNAGIEVRTNYLLGSYLWDLYLPKLGILVEVDGYDFHRNLTDLIRDNWKSNDGQLRGFTVLRYSASCVKNYMPLVVEQILTAKSPNLNGAAHRNVWSWHKILRRY